MLGDPRLVLEDLLLVDILFWRVIVLGLVYAKGDLPPIFLRLAAIEVRHFFRICLFRPLLGHGASVN